MSSEILNEFIFDSREHLSTAGGQLLALEKEPGSLAALNALMGTLHTIKGNSGFVDLKNLYGLMHRSESLLQTVREVPGLSCPPRVIDQLFQVLDTAEAILARLENGEDDRVDWLESLSQVLGQAEADLERQAAAKTAPAPGPAAGAAVADRPAAAAPVPVLAKAKNLSARIKMLALANGQLAAAGESFVAAALALFGAGLKGLVIDLRQLDHFSSVELAALIALHKQSGGQVVLVMDQARQAAFFRVFQVLYLDRLFHFFADEKAAAAFFTEHPGTCPP